MDGHGRLRGCPATLDGMTGLVLSVTLATGLVVLADIDRRTGRLPNVILWPLLGVCTVAAFTTPTIVAAMIFSAAPYLAGFALRRCGGGDVKLAVACGALVCTIPAALLMLLVAGLITVVQCAAVRRSSVPHGPALVAGSLVAATVGTALT